MHARIDWYEFVYNTEDFIGAQGQGALTRIEEHLNHAGLLRLLVGKMLSEWDVYPGRGIWSTRYQNPENKMSISVSTTRGGMKIELPGEACSFFEIKGLLLDIILDTKQWCSRIDFAADKIISHPYDANVNSYVPLETLRGKDKKRALSMMHSVSGDTVYLGSWSSERFSRCYHYNEPHPRSHLIRFEAVYKGRWAKRFLEELTHIDVVRETKTALMPFKWNTPDIANLSSTDNRVTMTRADKSGGGHTRWLVAVCVPSLKKAIMEGELETTWLLHALGYRVPESYDWTGE